jgi:FtsP/CotA-like multicopper oxidase with cupredoxin domain
VETTRRTVLKAGGLGLLGAVGATALPWGSAVGARTAGALDPALLPAPFTTPFARPHVLQPWRSTRNADGVWTDHFAVTEHQATAGIVPGMRTPILGYDGSAPGPTINVRQGRESALTVVNRLPRTYPTLGYEGGTSVHLHGSASLPQYDGYASDVTPTGFTKTYHYPNFQRARTLWYHDHAVHHTATNAYSGLYAQYHLHDPAELDLLPQGEYDVPLTVVDATFAADGSLAYDDNSESGLWGDVILVNGQPWPVMQVKRRVYRFRVLNASISRSYRFALDTGDPVTIVATDGGLMPRSREVTQWRHAGAERYEVLIDFRRYRPGQRVVLRNLSNPNNRDYDHTDKVMAFDVTDEPFSTRDATWNRVPDLLAGSDVMDLTESMAKRTRHMALERKNGQWTINGTTWTDIVNSDFQQVFADPDVGDVEVWELENRSGGWFHPLHIHLVDFKILSRNGQAPFDWERGPKDVAYLGEGETVRVVMKFGPHRGRYMVHCHNLPHEDHDMMTQFAVGWRPGQFDPNDPVLAAPPTPNRVAA